MAPPGRRNITISPAESGLSPFQDNAAAIYTIANTGAMLLIEQELSTLNAALVVESVVRRLYPWRTKADSSEFTGPYNRRAAAARAVSLTDARETSYWICSSLLTAECSTIELPGNSEYWLPSCSKLNRWQFAP